MSDEKPLHVRVAEALGWTDCQSSWIGDAPPRRSAWVGRGHPWYALEELRYYDTDWSATGPLIERYEITIDAELAPAWRAESWFHAPTGYPEDEEYGGRWQCREAQGDTPLIAVCNLILALKEAGKL